MRWLKRRVILTWIPFSFLSAGVSCLTDPWGSYQILRVRFTVFFVGYLPGDGVRNKLFTISIAGFCLMFELVSFANVKTSMITIFALSCSSKRTCANLQRWEINWNGPRNINLSCPLGTTPRSHLNSSTPPFFWRPSHNWPGSHSDLGALFYFR